jgi:FtsH-binding integral membrane protein
MNERKYLKIKYIVPIIYLSILVVCLFFAFGIKGFSNPIWYKIPMLLTLPWSLLISLLAIVFLHDENILSVIVEMLLVFGVINAFLLYLGLKRIKMQ